MVPGNLDEKTCKKYAAIFNKDCDFKRCTYNAAGGTSSMVVQGYSSWKLNAGYMNKRAYNTALMHMKYAGLIDFDYKNEGTGGYNRHCGTDNCGVRGEINATVDSAGIGKVLGETEMYFPQLSFDPETYVRIMGFNFNYKSTYYVMAQANLVSNRVDEFTPKHKQALNMHNVIMFSKPYKNTNAKDRMAQRSALNAKLSSELDAKIDDGKPTTGKLVGVKTMYGLFNPTEEVCYDNNELYLNTTENKYGCHLFKVMEDIK